MNIYKIEYHNSLNWEKYTVTIIAQSYSKAYRKLYKQFYVNRTYSIKKIHNNISYPFIISIKNNNGLDEQIPRE